MREGQPVDRVVGRPAPVDQLVDHVAADLERQDRGHHARIVCEIGVAGALGDETAEPVAADRPGGKGGTVAQGEHGHCLHLRESPVEFDLVQDVHLRHQRMQAAVVADQARTGPVGPDVGDHAVGAGHVLGLKNGCPCRVVGRDERVQPRNEHVQEEAALLGVQHVIDEFGHLVGDRRVAVLVAVVKLRRRGIHHLNLTVVGQQIEIRVDRDLGDRRERQRGQAALPAFGPLGTQPLMCSRRVRFGQDIVGEFVLALASRQCAGGDVHQAVVLLVDHRLGECDLHVLAAEAGKLTLHHQRESRVGDALLGEHRVPVVGDPGPAQQPRAQLVGQRLPGGVVTERDDPFGVVGPVGFE